MASTRTSIVKKARELSQSDVGDAFWSDDLKTRTQSASDEDIGFLVVASAILLSAKNEREHELQTLYQQANNSYNAAEYKRARQLFESLGSYSDSKQKAERAATMQKLQEKEAADRLRNNEAEYKRAQKLLNNNDYDRALVIFENLGSFRDSPSKAAGIRSNERTYKTAKEKYSNRDYRGAERAFSQLGGYKDSPLLAEEARKQHAAEENARAAAELQTKLQSLKTEEENLLRFKKQREEAQRQLTTKTNAHPVISGCFGLIMGFLAFCAFCWTLAWLLELFIAIPSGEGYAGLGVLTLAGPGLAAVCFVYFRGNIKREEDDAKAQEELSQIPNDLDDRLANLSEEIAACEKSLARLI